MPVTFFQSLLREVEECFFLMPYSDILLTRHFFPFILLLYLLQYITFSKGYGKDLLSNIFFFSRATELRKVLLVVE